MDMQKEQATTQRQENQISGEDAKQLLWYLIAGNCCWSEGSRALIISTISESQKPPEECGASPGQQYCRYSHSDRAIGYDLLRAYLNGDRIDQKRADLQNFLVTLIDTSALGVNDIVLIAAHPDLRELCLGDLDSGLGLVKRAIDRFPRPIDTSRGYEYDPDRDTFSGMYSNDGLNSFIYNKGGPPFDVKELVQGLAARIIDMPEGKRRDRYACDITTLFELLVPNVIAIHDAKDMVRRLLPDYDLRQLDLTVDERKIISYAGTGSPLERYECEALIRELVYGAAVRGVSLFEATLRLAEGRGDNWEGLLTGSSTFRCEDESRDAAIERFNLAFDPTSLGTRELRLNREYGAKLIAQLKRSSNNFGRLLSELVAKSS